MAKQKHKDILTRRSLPGPREPQVVVQHIHTMWTKASRGGNGARIRNALPIALPLPLDVFVSPWTLHSINFYEHDAFTKKESVTKAASPEDLAIRVLRFTIHCDRLAVCFLRHPMNAATASRFPSDPPGREILEVDAFALDPSQWGQLTYNGRFVDIDTGNWWYKQSVFNIGYCLKPAKDVFRTTRPASRFVELAQLH